MARAIVTFGSSQYEVSPGAAIEVARMDRPAGDIFDWEKVLFVAHDEGKEASIGKPYVAGAKVQFRVLEHCRGEKVIIFKKRSKKAWKKKAGHRSELTRLQVQEITVN